MQAPSTPFPHIGEWYSYDDLFHDFPDYWVLLAYPRELTPEEDWNIMGTPGELIAMDADKAAVRKAYRAYKAKHATTMTFFFATDRPDDDLILIAGGGFYAATNGVDAHDVVHGQYDVTLEEAMVVLGQRVAMR